MKFLNYLLLGLFFLGFGSGFLFLFTKQYLAGLSTLLGAFLVAVLGTWLADSRDDKAAALDAGRQTTKSSPPLTTPPNINASKPGFEVSPVITLKNYEGGRDVSVQCSGITGNVKCTPAK
ncbi:hypothetical protein [Comamonas sp.]|uniref:hypothetical protein n=1 Tax=Comamonas sp. TaxID=34028 RepID=UPI003A9296AB